MRKLRREAYFCFVILKIKGKYSELIIKRLQKYSSQKLIRNECLIQLLVSVGIFVYFFKNIFMCLAFCTFRNFELRTYLKN